MKIKVSTQKSHELNFQFFLRNLYYAKLLFIKIGIKQKKYLLNLHYYDKPH